jgi:predicted metal-dependent peptidase
MLDKDKEERRLKKVKISLMRNPKFAYWQGIMMVGKTELREDFPSAATNGRDEWYGRKFVSELDDKELGFVVLHENLHKAFRHLFIWKKLEEIDRDLTNAACDYVINLMIVEMDPTEQVVAMPKKDGKPYGLIDQRFKGMNTKQVFDILRKEQEEGGGGSGGGFDLHDWDGAKELSEEDKKVLEREIDQAIRQGQIAHQKIHGKGAGDMNRELGELLEPTVDWREVLRRFVRTSLKDRDSASWRKAHKNFLWQDVILPSILGKRMKWLVIAMDTSGSIQGQLLTDFLSEMNGCVSSIGADRVDVIYWDAEVAGHETYKGNTKNIVHQTNPKGGGGTDPDVVVDFMQEKRMTPDALIMLSDGHMHTNKQKWAAIKAPTLWCILGNDKYEVPNGQKLVIR